jgi:hypothetical protein
MVLITLLVIGCVSTSNQRPSGVAQPDLNVRLVNPPFFGSGTTAPATLEVTTTNRANVPITLRRLEIDSPGMIEYALIPFARDYNETIAPGETKTLTAFATARTGIARLTPSEPLSIRVAADFMVGKTRFRDIYVNLRADR